MSASPVAYFWLEASNGGWRVGAEISGVRMTSRRLFATLQDAAAFLRHCREVRSISRAAWYFPGITGGPSWATSGGGGPVDQTAS